MLCRTAVAIETNGLFEKLWPGKNIRFYCIEHDKPQREAKNRLDRVRKIFTEENKRDHDEN